MKERCKGPPAYETPAMVTYQAEDLLEEIKLTQTGWCSPDPVNTNLNGLEGSGYKIQF